MEVKPIEKDGKTAIVLETKGAIMPNGYLVTVSKYINIKPDLHQFIQDQIKEYKRIKEAFGNKPEGKNFYVSVNIKPKIKGKVVEQYDKVFMDVLDDGREFLKIDGWVNDLNTEHTDDGDFITYDFGPKGTKRISIDEISEPVLEATMIVLSQDNNGRIELTSAGNYPKTLIVYADPNATVKGKAKIGQGYNFLLGFEKGKLIKNSAPEEKDLTLSWDSVEKVEKANRGGKFEPDKLVIYSVGLEKGFVLEGISANKDGLDPLDSMMNMLK